MLGQDAIGSKKSHLDALQGHRHNRINSKESNTERLQAASRAPDRLTRQIHRKDVLAIDTVDAGVNDTVLIIQEGAGAQQVLKRKDMPVHTVIVAVVDGLDIVQSTKGLRGPRLHDSSRNARSRSQTGINVLDLLRLSAIPGVGVNG